MKAKEAPTEKWKQRTEMAQLRIRDMAKQTKESLWKEFLPTHLVDLVPFSTEQWDASSVSEDDAGKAVLETCLRTIEENWQKVQLELAEREMRMMAGVELEASD